MQRYYTEDLREECESKLGRSLTMEETLFIEWMAERQCEEMEGLTGNRAVLEAER
ncbi:hypothetical protein [Alteribacillus sp. YIM 98480]|uniref:hypothetical protein n=1 Tax=Alteribacillus sp. YIM 98480 TaxID=2606599 RepID=UPI00131DC151|nr:hypothetical protein [Alteribacillus sp. YIM 98480]